MGMIVFTLKIPNIWTCWNSKRNFFGFDLNTKVKVNKYESMQISKVYECTLNIIFIEASSIFFISLYLYILFFSNSPSVIRNQIFDSVFIGLNSIFFLS
jgi:hypothetical protein